MMKLHQKHRLIVLRNHSKMNIPISFQVPKGINKLVIELSYFPKELEDREENLRLIKENLIRDAGEHWQEYTDYGEFMPLKNLITVSLDSPVGYVGAAHRQSPDQSHKISAEFASPGFDKTEIYEGEWTLTFNLHAVVTEQCICEIGVMGYE